VALLFKHVRLTLPLPHKELTLLLASQRDPVTCIVDGDAVDLMLRDLKAVNGLKRINVINAEDTV